MFDRRITEIEMDMQICQGYDEFHDAKEMMTEAKQDVLYIKGIECSHQVYNLNITIYKK